MTVGVKFCGHCKLQRDMAKLYRELKERCPQHRISPVSELEKMDVLLVLNACPTACASISPFSGPVIRVTPDSVSSRPVAPERLLDETERRLREISKGLNINI